MVVSAGGSVPRAALRQSRAAREHLALVVGRRACGGTDLARELGVPSLILPSDPQFSDRLLSELERASIDFAYLFFDRLLRGEILVRYSGRIINFHPALLPDVPGLHAFERSVELGSGIGSTAHFVTERLDAGPVIISSPILPATGVTTALRHRVFVDQVRALIQVDEWLAAGRVSVDQDTVRIRGADYSAGPLRPAIESRAALAFDPVHPGDGSMVPHP